MIPLRLSVRNFLCYRDDVPPLGLQGIHVACLCGANGHGKSALLDAMTWCLWGQAPDGQPEPQFADCLRRNRVPGGTRFPGQGPILPRNPPTPQRRPGPHRAGPVRAGRRRPAAANHRQHPERNQRPHPQPAGHGLRYLRELGVPAARPLGRIHPQNAVGAQGRVVVHPGLEPVRNAASGGPQQALPVAGQRYPNRRGR